MTQLDSELYLSPGFAVPPSSDYQGYHAYVDRMLPPESPALYGLHPNAEVGVLTVTSNKLFETILEMAPRSEGETGDANNGGGGGGGGEEELVRSALDHILERLPEDFPLQEIGAKTQERTPYILVCFQECERMNLLLREIRSLPFYLLPRSLVYPFALGKCLLLSN